MLKIENLSKSFGGLRAVDGFSLDLGAGDIQGIIGPNGAGKTTVFNLITGIYRPDTGRVVLAGDEVSGIPSDEISRRGIARTFQNIRLFGKMSVWDNIVTAFHQRMGYGLWDAVFHLPRFKSREQQVARESLAFLERFGLAERRNELAENLPYGEQRRLEIARALATDPRVLLLDEPAAGMNPTEVDGLIGLIRDIHRDFDLSILLIEHHMPVVLKLCQYVQVMDFGRTIAGGNPHEVTGDPVVIKAYLGDEEDSL
ncbi:ABC transporter ATP-binding protein [Geobacter sp. FeAm09]|uniref:ABC transporter ATP-binding protein n=1 Tax=Geobacter sp. FeAm09 TaxID=2597769 RepID=UPI0011EE2195|nr:ABC transporter ATP-binding protein [Geobacter sp. FeAm09]QEM67667.1 ABC transporter ATP-binding protein [Geobacter sp. FeAm09]